jgi:hypothetical protein
VRCALALATLMACGTGAEQHQVTAEGELLTDDGRLREPGWSPTMLQRWDASRVAVPDQLRQWDFFTIQSDAAAVNLTLVDLGFLEVATVGVVDLATAETFSSVRIVGGGDVLTLTDRVEGNASLTIAGAAAPGMTFTTDATSTAITIDVPVSSLGVAAQGTFTLHRRAAMPYLSLATPFAEDPQLFFYEQKIPGMTAEGTLTIGTRTFTFAADSTDATMDWGRGAWPDMALWRWAAASGIVDGEPLAFNLGNGFGDARAGSENLVVAADVAHKLAAVEWTYDPADPLADWRFDAGDGRMALTLHPIAPEVGGLDFGAVFSRLHKAYGTFSGTIVLDDGRTVTIDGMRGFAEQMELAW